MDFSDLYRLQLFLRESSYLTPLGEKKAHPSHQQLQALILSFLTWGFFSIHHLGNSCLFKQFYCGWPGTLNVDQAGLQLAFDPSASVFQVMVLSASATRPGISVVLTLDSSQSLYPSVLSWRSGEIHPVLCES